MITLNFLYAFFKYMYIFIYSLLFFLSPCSSFSVVFSCVVVCTGWADVCFIWVIFQKMSNDNGVPTQPEEALKVTMDDNLVSHFVLYKLYLLHFIKNSMIFGYCWLKIVFPNLLRQWTSVCLHACYTSFNFTLITWAVIFILTRILILVIYVYIYLFVYLFIYLFIVYTYINHRNYRVTEPNRGKIFRFDL